MNLKGNKNTKEKKRKEKKNTYTTLKERKPSLLANHLVSQVSTGIYISNRRF